MATINDLLDDTGNIDAAKVAEVSSLRAAREFGSMSYPPRELRAATQFVMERAQGLRLEYRRMHRLPDDSPVSTFRSYAPDTNE